MPYLLGGRFFIGTMSFFKKLSSLFTPIGKNQDVNGFFVTAQCNRCGEILYARINLMNDLSIDYGHDDRMTFFCRKVLMGTQRCFQKVEVTMKFDGNRKLMEKEIKGGRFVDE